MTVKKVNLIDYLGIADKITCPICSCNYVDHKIKILEEIPLVSGCGAEFSLNIINAESGNTIIQITMEKSCQELEILESPIEEMFWNEALTRIYGIVPQYEIGPYRVDFAIPDKKVAIELDGHDYHKTKEQRTNDAQRERYLELEGWRVIRFTGTEVYKDAIACVEQANELIEKWSNHNE